MANLSYGGAATSSYLDLARKGQIYMAQAIVTAPVIYTTAAGTGGPLLWNGTGGVTAGVRNAAVDAVILGIGFGATVASTVATTFGVTGGAGQTAAPTATTTLDGVASTLIRGVNIGANGAGNACSVYRIGTVSTAANWFHPLASLSTTAITSFQHEPNWVDLAGMYVVPPGSWFSPSVSATATTAVMQIALVWAEIPRL